MKTIVTALLAIGLFVTALPLAPEAGAATPPMKFGMDAGAIGAQSNAGVKPDYATIWVGPWTLKSGWGGPDSQMDAMKAAGVTPAIHFYYWGDDISQSCLENGCWSSLHGAQKTKAGWKTLADQLVSHLHSKMAGKPVLIFVETEFNKADVQTYEPLDGYLADKAKHIRNGYPAAKIVMALGNWNSPAWGTWDRFAAASDFTGIQGMRGSTRDSSTAYDTLYEATLSGAKTLQSKFGKPIVITDIALSSYPTSTYTQKQADSLAKFFKGMGSLKQAGVQAMLYRSWFDSPKMDLANYYGEAERHWGLATSTSWKPSATVWVNGVKAERGGSTTTTTTTTSGTFAATFTVASGSNEWWQEVKVSSTSKVSKVEMQVNGGTWKGLALQSWGNWATSTQVTKGSSVIFRATDSTGKTTTSQTIAWLGGTTSTSTSSGTATFAVASGSNEWWQEVKVSSTTKITKVEMQVNGGTWKGLALQSWGNWATSTHVPKGTPVAFRATDANGKVTTSPTQPWLGSTTTTTTTSFSATFSPKSVGNDWWVETAVASSQGIAKVEVKLNSGSWQDLPKNSWGTYSKSVKAPDGTKVTFRATSTNGATATSQVVTWT